MLRENSELGSWQTDVKQGSQGYWVNWVNERAGNGGDAEFARPGQERNRLLLGELAQTAAGQGLLRRLGDIPCLAVPTAQNIQADCYRLPAQEGEWFLRHQLRNMGQRRQTGVALCHLFWAAAHLCDTLVGLNRENLLGCQIDSRSLLLRPLKDDCQVLLLDFHALRLLGREALFPSAADSGDPIGAASLLEACLFDLDGVQQRAMERFLRQQASPLRQQLKELAAAAGLERERLLTELKTQLRQLGENQRQRSHPTAMPEKISLYLVIFPGQQVETCPLPIGWLCQCFREELAAWPRLQATITCIYADHGLQCQSLPPYFTPELPLDADAAGAGYGELLDMLRRRLLEESDDPTAAPPLVYYYFPLGGHEKAGSRQENYLFRFSCQELYQLLREGNFQAFCTVQGAQVYGDDSWKLLSGYPYVPEAPSPDRNTAASREALCRLLRSFLSASLSR